MKNNNYSIHLLIRMPKRGKNYVKLNKMDPNKYKVYISSLTNSENEDNLNSEKSLFKYYEAEKNKNSEKLLDEVKVQFNTEYEINKILQSSKEEYEKKEDLEIQQIIIKLNHKDMLEEKKMDEVFNVGDRIKELTTLLSSVEDNDSKESILDTISTLKQDFHFSDDNESEDDFGYSAESEDNYDYDSYCDSEIESEEKE